MKLAAVLVLVATAGAFLFSKFGLSCQHKKLGFPHTAPRGVKKSAAASVTGTYVVCLDCGTEFPYDWHKMRIISAKELKHARNSVTVTNS